MGQQVTKEQGSPSGHSRTFSGQHGTDLPSSSSLPGIAASSSSTSISSPPPPPPLPSHLADDVKVDAGGLVPQGVYTGPQDYDQHFVRQAVVDRRLAPFCKGSDDEETYESEPYNSECPICFLSYPSPLNFSRCCHQPICTECFVQMKRADPNATNPPSSEARACPFCVEPDFGVTYASPAALEAQQAADGSGPDSPNDAVDAANFAEMAIGTGGATAACRGSGKQKVLPVDDPSVVTVDQIRPDWQAKLAQAHATIARRANRRVIMRQVGDRLIPIGISSSRVGADLAAAAEDGRINLNGPGGSIILQERQGWPGGSLGGTTSSRRRGRGSRSEGPNSDLARFMRMTSGEEMEEMMMMEAMRLSLLEHEEQQKRESEAAKASQKAKAAHTAGEVGAKDAEVANSRSEVSRAAASTATATRTREAGSHSPASDASAAPSASSARSSGSGSEPPSQAGARPQAIEQPTRSAKPVDAASLGLSPTMMADLSELIEGGPPVAGPRSTSVVGSSSASAWTSRPLWQDDSIMSSPHRPVRTSMPAPAPVPVPQPVAGMGSAVSAVAESANGANVRQSIEKHDVRVSTSNGHGMGMRSGNSSPFGSPSSSGFATATGRTVNPKNPFRRSMGESS